MEVGTVLKGKKHVMRSLLDADDALFDVIAHLLEKRCKQNDLVCPGGKRSGFCRLFFFFEVGLF